MRTPTTPASTTQVHGSMDWQSPRSDTTGLQLPRRALRHGALGVTQQAGPVKLGAELGLFGFGLRGGLARFFGVGFSGGFVACGLFGGGLRSGSFAGRFLRFGFGGLLLG